MANRLNTLDFTYVKIALRSYKIFIETEEELDEIDKKYGIIDSEKKFYSLIYERTQPREALIENYISTIIFSSLAIEAYIYDLGASITSDEYVIDHLDKLGLIDKWITIPRIILNKDMDKSKKWFELLKKIVYTRNNFVHSKSKNLDIDKWNNDESYREKNNIVYNPKYIAASDAILLLQLLDKELREKDELNTIEHQLFHFEYFETNYPELKIK